MPSGLSEGSNGLGPLCSPDQAKQGWAGSEAGLRRPPGPIFNQGPDRQGRGGPLLKSMAPGMAREPLAQQNPALLLPQSGSGWLGLSCHPCGLGDTKLGPVLARPRPRQPPPLPAGSAGQREGKGRPSVCGWNCDVTTGAQASSMETHRCRAWCGELPQFSFTAGRTS